MDIRLRKRLKNHHLLSHFIVICVLLVLIVLSLMIAFNSSLGWFANNNNVYGSSMNVKADGTVFPEMKAWRFNLDETIDDDENGDAFDKSGSWVNAIDESTTTLPKGILPVVEKAYAENTIGEKWTFYSLHLGTIDNLLTMSNDNCFYIRFDVTNIIYQASVSYSLLTSGIHVYGYDGNDETSYIAEMDDTLSESNPTQSSLQQFVDIFQVDVGVSSEEYTPSENQEQIDELFFTGETRTGLLTNNGASIDLPAQEKAYYIYFRFSPDLEKCFEATDDIVSLMPCEVTFDISLTIVFD